MAAPNDNVSMALFCDFENIALGVRDAQYEKFDIRPILERLLAKGSIVVKKAYCDWDRYKGFKAAMHEANFELIEIPHVRVSGKNSADIRMVVDALDLCYTKSHVDTFVIISGDSDFSPLVSKLRENAKRVIGVGVKQSCSDLLVTNCDEFIYYDYLVPDRDAARTGQRRDREKRSPEEEAKRSEKQEERKSRAVDIVSTTFIDMVADSGEGDRIWASVLKEVVKRRNPGFSENYYGFRSFGNLLEEAAGRGLLGFDRDDKGAYVFRVPSRTAVVEGEAEDEKQPVPNGVAATSTIVEVAAGSEDASAGAKRGRKLRSRNGKDSTSADEAAQKEAPAGLGEEAFVPEIVLPTTHQETPGERLGEAVQTTEKKKLHRGGRRPRKALETVVPVVQMESVAELLASEVLTEPTGKANENKSAKEKRSVRAPRTRKPKARMGEVS